VTRSAAIVVGGALVAAVSGDASAEALEHAEHRFELGVPDGWARDGDALVWNNADTGERMTVTRIGAPNGDAWRGSKAFFATIESGVVAGATGYKSIKRKRSKAGRVPTLDLWFENQTSRGDDVVTVMRFLLFRRYSVVLAVDTPATTWKQRRRAMRRIARGFKPWFPPPAE
jgi:hypothetical protein